MGTFDTEEAAADAFTRASNKFIVSKPYDVLEFADLDKDPSWPAWMCYERLKIHRCFSLRLPAGVLRDESKDVTIPLCVPNELAIGFRDKYFCDIEEDPSNKVTR